MSQGPNRVFAAVSVASGASTSSGINLARVYPYMAVKVGTMSTAMVTKIQASVDGGSTYQDVNLMAASAVTQVNPLNIGASFAAGGGIVVLPQGSVPFNNIRFVLTGVVSGGVSFTVVCSD
jgi:hypothetical protein